MKNVIALLIIGALAWYGYGRFKERTSPTAAPPPMALAGNRASAPPPPRFACDGRTHCSHMRSCAEATWFLQHCPGTEMDGDNDGIPCERQWCH